MLNEKCRDYHLFYLLPTKRLIYYNKTTMKHKKLLLIAIMPFMLSSCVFNIFPIGPGPKPSTINPEQTVEVKFTAINDFHGAIEEVPNRNVGLAKLATYLKQRKEEGSILINSGDFWQGSFLSNYTKGTLITECFKEIGFDANVLGNHEFDWGEEIIRLNEEAIGERFLGANIYKYPKTGSTWEKADLGKPYVIKTINKGTDDELKIGIIGAIGSKQITSITSTKVKDYIFYDHSEVIIEQSKILKEKEKCDIVVASVHAADGFSEAMAGVSGTLTSRGAVDAVFMGHTHYVENYVVNNVPFIQGGEFGKYGSEVSLIYNKVTKEIEKFEANNNYLADLKLTEDPTVKQLINGVKEVADAIGNEIIGTLDRTMDEDMMSRYYAKLAAEKAIELGYDVDYCIFNSSREPLYRGDFNYSQLFETHPFLNDLYIIRVNGNDMQRELVSYPQPMYRVDLSPLSTKSSSWYNVLVFDYNGMHMTIDENYNKTYNYFPSFVNSDVEPILLKEEGKKINVFDLALSSLEIDNTITYSDYTTDRFDNSKVKESIA